MKSPMNPTRTPAVDHPFSLLVPGLPALLAALVLAAPPAAASTVSYDTDGDGLIEISSLAQLNAVRWDLDGDGAADSGVNASAHAAAFPNPAAGMGCAAADHDGHSATPDVPVCTGYELKGNLDFDTSGDGAVNSADEYWNGGAGWEPIGSSGSGNEFIATFEGNGHTITRLYIDRSSGRIGLFGVVGDGGQVRNLGVLEVAVTGSGRGIIVGGLAGTNAGIIAGSYVTGSVGNTGTGAGYVGGLVGRNAGSSGDSRSIVASHASASVTGSGSHGKVGGLAGYNYGSIRASYATGAVRGTGRNGEVGGLVGFHNGGSIAVSYASGAVTGENHVGGLVGKSWGGGIWACYASGAVTGKDYVGGLVGEIQASIRASYATGWVTGTGTNVGGLVGRDYDLAINNSASFIGNCYWNTTTSGKVSSAGGEGKTTAELQTPTGYAGIYAAWNLDLDNADGDRDATTGGDDPWDFGTAQQYPALRADFDGDGTATWQEFGEQRPDATPPAGGGSADDATLRALGVSPVDIEGFAADVLSYHIGVANAVSQVTVTPYLSDDGATIDIDGSTVSSGSGHTVSLAEGRNEITIKVTAQDGTTTREYSIAADRGSDAPFGWKVTEDFNDLELDSGVTPRGIWSNGTTMWVACATGNDNTGANLCSYDMSAKERGVDFHTLGTHGNNSPMGITSNDGTMYVADAADDKIYAYKMHNYSRDPSKEFNTLGTVGNGSPTGITESWVGKHMLVADLGVGKTYAYAFRTRSRDCYDFYVGPALFRDCPEDEEINTQAAGNARPMGMCRFRNETLWIADSDDAKLYAYDLFTGEREPSNDFNTLAAAGNTAPWGIWTDGETMWVADREDRKIYSYNMPSRTEATLTGLTVSPVDILNFDSEVTSYRVGVGNEVTEVTVTATVTAGATIDSVTTPGDTIYVRSTVTSQSVPLAEGPNDIRIWVGSGDRQTTKVYTVSVGRSATATFGWNAVKDFDTLDAAGNRSPGGLWSDGTTMWVVDTRGDKIHAYNMATTARDAAKDLDTPNTAGNNRPEGLWSDGTTMWVSDSEDGKLYAYSLSTGARDASKDFDGLKTAGNEDPAGIWSDGTTMWVVDDEDNHIYAYDLLTKARDSARDFDYVTGPGSGLFEYIWSDSTTIWVANWNQSRLYAYYLASGTRDSSRDFATLRAAGNDSPTGIWSDGVTMWVADGDPHGEAKIYAYNMPAAAEPPPPPPSPYAPSGSFSQVSAGRSHNCGLRTDGSVVCWGSSGTSDYGQSDAPSGSFSQVSAGAYHSCGVRTDGTVLCWGRADNGRADAPSGSFSEVSAGWAHSCGLRTDGGVVCWGGNQYGQTDAPGGRFSQVSARGEHSCGLRTDGSVECWGRDDYDQTTDTPSDRFSQVSASTYHSCGVRTDGGVVCWGGNNHGQRNPPSGNFSQVSAGFWHSCGVKTDGGVACWGSNLDGRRDAPGGVFSQVSAGLKHSCGVRTDGTLECWGLTPVPDPEPEPLLRALTVSPVDLPGFDADVTTYHVGVANSVTQVSITATATDAGSTIDIGGTSVSSGSSYPVSLSEGRNEVTITVTGSDGQTAMAYTVVIGRGVTTPFGWKAVDDFNTLVTGNNHPAGLWSDGTTLWVANYNNAPESKIFAYNLSTKARDAAKDFNTLKAAGNDDPRGLWSDGTTMWVADGRDARIYAYSLSTRARDASKDFGTLSAAGNDDPRGLWSDGTTMWVVNHDNNDDRVFAYDLATKARNAAKEISTPRSDGNQRAFGIWSDGVTLWVGDSLFLRLFAYDLATGSRDSAKDFTALHPTLTHVTLGIWSDGETMWVTDLSDRKIYSYNMPSKAGGTQAQATTDFNGDGKTDFADFFLFIDAYGGTDARFDLDGNGTVDFADFFKFIDAFNPSGQAKLVAMARDLIGLPGETELRQNWPNPFNSETVFSWFLLRPGPVRLEVFSLTGQRLAVLRQGPLPTGYHRLRWDGRDEEGRPLASGVYLFRLVTGETVLTRKLTLLR